MLQNIRRRESNFKYRIYFTFKKLKKKFKWKFITSFRAFFRLIQMWLRPFMDVFDRSCYTTSNDPERLTVLTINVNEWLGIDKSLGNLMFRKKWIGGTIRLKVSLTFTDRSDLDRFFETNRPIIDLICNVFVIWNSGRMKIRIYSD